jgi:hypothetical protein
MRILVGRPLRRGLIAAMALVGIFAFASQPAWAQTTGTGTVTCSAVNGVIKFQRQLLPHGRARHENVHLHAVLSGCTIANSTNVTKIPRGTIAADWTIFAHNANRCTSLISTPISSLSLNWSGVEPTTSQPLLPTMLSDVGEIWNTGVPSMALVASASSGSFGGGPITIGFASLTPLGLHGSPGGCSSVVKHFQITALMGGSVTLG